MPFAAASSEHPLATHAVGEVVGDVLESLGAEADLAILFITSPHVGATEDIARAVRELLTPRVFLAVTAASIVGGRREIEDHGAVSLWAGKLSVGRPVRMTADRAVGAPEMTGVPALDGGDTLLVLADPYSFAVDDLLGHLGAAQPGTEVIGGLASAARGPGGNRLVLDDQVYDDGAVGVVLPAGSGVRTVVSQGCRPIGEPMTVTKVERNVIYELAGQPTLHRLRAAIEVLEPDERILAQKGLHIGVAMDESRDDFERGDFLIRNVVGADQANGAVSVSGEVELGTTVQFQVRDAAAADEDLRALLATSTGDSALLFTCSGRGRHLFGTPHHDAALVSDAVDDGPTAGMFCAGELGPVGGRSYLHGLTASIALFSDP